MFDGEEIRKKRIEMGLTQKEVCSKCGIDILTLRCIEKNRRNIRHSTLKVVKDVLHMD